MIITPAQVREELHSALRRALPDFVSIYTGRVPDRVPTYRDGTIKPYIGLWISNSVGDPTMSALDSTSPTDAVRVRIQTQVVAATEDDVYEVADLVTNALTNHPVGQGVLLPDAEQQANAYPLWDDSTTPPIPYLPLLWRLETQ